MPEIKYPIGQDLRLTIVTAASDGAPVIPAPSAGKTEAQTRLKINTIRETFNALRACWIPPPQAEARAHMQIRFD
jgi:hypothetical protein